MNCNYKNALNILFKNPIHFLMDAIWRAIAARLDTAQQVGTMDCIGRHQVEKAEHALHTELPAELKSYLLGEIGAASGSMPKDVWQLFHTSLLACAEGAPPAKPWLWGDTPRVFADEHAAVTEAAAAVTEAASAAAAAAAEVTPEETPEEGPINPLQGSMLLGTVTRDSDITHASARVQVLLILHGPQRGNVWVLEEAAGTVTGAEAGHSAIALAPLRKSSALGRIPDMGTPLASIITHGLTLLLGPWDVLDRMSHSMDAVASSIPVALSGPLAGDVAFEPLAHWVGGPCPAIVTHAMTEAPHFRLPPNPSRPCDGILVSGLPADGAHFWDTVCALDVGLVVTMLPLPLTTAGPAAAPPGVPSPTPELLQMFGDASLFYQPLHRIYGLAITPEEVQAVRFAVNFRVSRDTPTSHADIARRSNPEEFAKALHAAAILRGVVFLHLPTPDGHVLHSRHVDTLVKAAQAAWNRNQRVWVHCWAGVYRSYLAAMVIMQRCVPRGAAMPLLHPRQILRPRFGNAAAAARADGVPPPDTVLSVRFMEHVAGVRACHLDKISDAAARHCRCVSHIHYLWMMLGHPQLAEMEALCLVPGVTSLQDAKTWVASMDAAADAKLAVAYDLEALHTGVWAWVRDAVAKTKTTVAFA
jgi:hypothetical protein